MKSNVASCIAMVIFLTLLFSSCGLMYRTLLGVDITPDWNSDSDIEKQARRYNIPSEYNLVMDTIGYYQGLRKIYKYEKEKAGITDKESVEYDKLLSVYKDDTQLVQFRLFENEGSEIFKLVGCYIEKPMSMNWNVGNCFDNFPPSIGIESLNKHYLDLKFFLDHSSLLNDKKYSLRDLPSSDYYGLIVWNEFMKKPSKKLIKEVREKVLDEKRSITLLYIHNQNSFLWNEMDSAQKEEVKSFYSE